LSFVRRHGRSGVVSGHREGCVFRREDRNLEEDDDYEDHGQGDSLTIPEEMAYWGARGGGQDAN